MPIELKYRDGDSGVVFVCKGVVTADDFYRANEEIYSEERIGRLRYQLIDFTATEHLESTSEEVRNNAQMDSMAAAQNPNFVIAIAGPDDLTFGISRIWHSMVSDSGIRCNVFRSVPEAERWIKDTLQGA